MGKKCVCLFAAVVALAYAPIAAGGRLVSVGYTAPSALHGLDVVTRIDALHTAEVRVPNARAERQLRSRPRHPLRSAGAVPE